jgi:uncharacterized protein
LKHAAQEPKRLRGKFVDKFTGDESLIAEIIASAHTVAVVGLSVKPDRPSYEVAAYLQKAGFKIIPVNPAYAGAEVLGERCYATLRDVPESIDIVDCFRQSDAIPPIVDDAIAVGAKCVWMQSGIVNVAAAQRARAAGLRVVMDRCLKVEHRVEHRQNLMVSPAK